MVGCFHLGSVAPSCAGAPLRRNCSWSNSAKSTPAYVWYRDGFFCRPTFCVVFLRNSCLDWLNNYLLLGIKRVSKTCVCRSESSSWLMVFSHYNKSKNKLKVQVKDKREVLLVCFHMFNIAREVLQKVRCTLSCNIYDVTLWTTKRALISLSLLLCIDSW